VSDAAFCNATFGGAGTSLVLIGAYVLAGELATTNDVHSALSRYQHVMQPFAGAAPRFSVGLAASPVGKAIDY
jgi:2-polyprenyl-6-methoxyphenol hydroxylase-like FAD-dependent oxidoreductase